METFISVSLGEAMLKGHNRHQFESQQIRQMKRALQELEPGPMYKEMGKIYIPIEVSKEALAIKRLQKVFGLVYICPVVRTEPQLEDLSREGLQLAKSYIEKTGAKTFKVETTRADKNFPLKSPEVSRRIGGYVLSQIPGLAVDVHQPDFILYVDIKQHGYVYIERFHGEGGMPQGTGGKGLQLLSGGIDSPVAAYMMAKRGMTVDGVHYHSYPFTPERSIEKIRSIGEILSRYMGPFSIYLINLLPIQEAIKAHCKPDYMTILSRRFMMRIAERIAYEKGHQALITGEALGQVASQTIESMAVINQVNTLPVLRPLVAMDKVDIVDRSREIETYEVSILPYEDSCSVFLPKRPITKPVLEKVLRQEANLDVEALVDLVLSRMEIMEIK